MRHSKSHFKLNRLKKKKNPFHFSSINISRTTGRWRVQGRERQKKATRKDWASLSFSRAVFWSAPWCTRCWSSRRGPCAGEGMFVSVHTCIQCRCDLSGVSSVAFPLCETGCLTEPELTHSSRLACQQVPKVLPTLPTRAGMANVSPC